MAVREFLSMSVRRQKDGVSDKIRFDVTVPLDA
jgi:hypothetical protein